MTTATKPLAAHGTTARAKGRPTGGVPGCPCRPCRKAENAYDKRRRFLNATGRELTLPVEPVAQHLDSLFAAGAGWIQLAAACRMSTSNVSKIRRRQQVTVSRSVAQRILAVKPGMALPPRRLVPAIGSVRRVHALMALGHPMKNITAAAGLDHTLVSDLINDRVATVTASTAAGIRTAYSALSAQSGVNVRALLRAERNQWAPPAAWDEGALDNPDAHPDWTGHCGTDRGWWTHRRGDQTPCSRCQEAHDEWRAATRHLSQAERARAMGAARAAAAGREAAIAEDARELYRQGLGRQQVAERLGVGLDQLNRSLVRHPVIAAETGVVA